MALSNEEIRRLQQSSPQRSGGTRQDPQLGDVNPDVGRARTYLGQFARGATGILGDVPSGVGDIIGGVAGENVVSENLRGAGEYIEGIGERLDINPEYAQDFGGQVASGLGSFAGFAAGGLAGRAVTGGSRLAQYGVPATLGALTAGEEQISDREATTGDELTQAERSETFFAGAPAGLTEAIPVGRALGRFGRAAEDITAPARRQVLRSGAAGAAEEAAQETLQNTLQNIVARDVLQYDRDRALADQLQESATVGGTVGFIANAGLTALGLRMRGTQERIQDAENIQDRAPQLGEVQQREEQLGLGLGPGMTPPGTPTFTDLESGRTIFPNEPELQRPPGEVGQQPLNLRPPEGRVGDTQRARQTSLQFPQDGVPQDNTQQELFDAAQEQLNLTPPEGRAGTSATDITDFDSQLRRSLNTPRRDTTPQDLSRETAAGGDNLAAANELRYMRLKDSPQEWTPADREFVRQYERERYGDRSANSVTIELPSFDNPRTYTTEELNTIMNTMSENQVQDAMGMMMPLYQPVVRTKWSTPKKLQQAAKETFFSNIESGAAYNYNMTVEEQNTIDMLFNNYDRLEAAKRQKERLIQQQDADIEAQRGVRESDEETTATDEEPSLVPQEEPVELSREEIDSIFSTPYRVSIQDDPVSPSPDPQSSTLDIINERLSNVEAQDTESLESNYPELLDNLNEQYEQREQDLEQKIDSFANEYFKFGSRNRIRNEVISAVEGSDEGKVTLTPDRVRGSRENYKKRWAQKRAAARKILRENGYNVTTINERPKSVTYSVYKAPSIDEASYALNPVSLDSRRELAQDEADAPSTPDQQQQLLQDAIQNAGLSSPDAQLETQAESTPNPDTAVNEENVLQFQPSNIQKRRGIREKNGEYQYVEESIKTGKTLKILARGDNLRNVRLEASGRVQAELERNPDAFVSQQQTDPRDTALRTNLTNEEYKQYQGYVTTLNNNPDMMTDTALKRMQTLEIKAGVDTTDARDPVDRTVDDELRNLGLTDDEFGVLDDDIDLMIDENEPASPISRNDPLYQRNLQGFLRESKVREPVYHGNINQDIREFNPMFAEFGFHFGTRQAAEDRIRDKQNRRQPVNGYMLPVYVRLENPIYIADLGNFDNPLNMIERIEEAMDNPQADTDWSRWSYGHQKVYDESTNSFVYQFNELIENEVNRDEDGNLTNDAREEMDRIQTEYMDKLQKLLKSAGIDGVIYRNNNEDPGSISHLVFDPEQIKSAIGNLGTFDTGNPNIDMNIDPREATQGMAQSEITRVKKFIDRLNEQGDLNVGVAFKWDDIPAWGQEGLSRLHQRFGGLKKAKGMRRGNEVVLIANNITDIKDFKRTLFHEVVGHYSMEQMFGKQWDNFVDQVGRSTEFQSQINEVAQRYALDMNDPRQRFKAVKEFIAANAEHNQNPTIVERALAWLRHQLRRLGIDIDISDNDLRAYLSRAANRLDNTSREVWEGSRNPAKSDVYFSIAENAPTRSDREDVLRVAQGVEQIDKQRLSQKYQNKVTDVMNNLTDRYFSWYTPMKRLGNTQGFLDRRQKALGGKTQADKLASQFYDSFKYLNKENRDMLYQFLTDRNQDVDVLPENIRNNAVKAREAVDNLGQELVRLGLLDKDIYETNKGTYLPNRYLKYVLKDDPRGFEVMAGGSTTSKMNYLKSRKDIPDDVKELLLGQITDPAFLVAETVATIGRDVALIDFLNDIAQAGNNWVYPGSTLEVDGMRMSTSALEQRIITMRDKLQDYTNDPDTFNRRQELINQYTEALNQAKAEQNATEVDLRDYEQVPNNARYGNLRGMFVRKEIYDDLIASRMGFSDGEASIAENILGDNGRLTSLNRFWKWAKTAGNPPTHFRNAIGNFIQLDMGTPTNTAKLMKIVADETVNGLKGDGQQGKYWAISNKYGITETTYASQELIGNISEWQKDVRRMNQEMRGNKLGRTHAAFNENFQRIIEKMGNVYQASESLFKTAKIRDYIERWERDNDRSYDSLDAQAKERLELDAVREAQKWIFDYSLVPRSLRYLRNAPIGAPFITFTYKSTPRIIEGMARHPQKFLKFIALPYLMAEAWMQANDADEEDYEQFMNTMPDWVQQRSSIYALPYKDENGNEQLMDFGYFFPWDPWFQMGMSAKQITEQERYTEAYRPLLDMGLLSGPVPTIIAALHTGKDSFTQQDIINDFDPKQKQFFDLMNYSWRQAAPTWLTDMGMVGHLLTLDERNEIGDLKGTFEQAALRGVGVNVYPQDPRYTYFQQTQYLRNQVSRAKARRTEIMRNPNLTYEEKTKQLRDYNEVVQRHTQRLRDYTQGATGAGG